MLQTYTLAGVVKQERLYNIEIIEQLDSTNTYLKDKVKACQLSSPYCVATDFQTDGRGRRSNLWIAKKGENVLCSFLVNNVSLNKLAALSNVASLAIAQTLEHFGTKQVEIKWPNDVYAEGKKIAGILIENMLEQNRVKHAIVGIGINVNQMEFGKVEATSIRKCIGKQLDIRSVLNYLYKSFYLFLDHSEVDLLRGVNFQLFMKEKNVTFLGPNGFIEVQVKQVMANGNLQVVKNGNSLLEFQYHTHQWQK